MTTPVLEPSRTCPLGNHSVSLRTSCSQTLAINAISVEPGWFYLGPAATNGSIDAVGLIIKDKTVNGSILRPVGDWIEIWNDAGSGTSTDFSLWRGIPRVEDEVNYIVLSGFFLRSHNKPSAVETTGIRAIHKDVLKLVDIGREVWTDAGTGADRDGSVWNISVEGRLDVLNPGYFLPAAGHNIPPKDTFGIDRSKVETPDNLDIIDPNTEEMCVHFCTYITDC